MTDLEALTSVLVQAQEAKHGVKLRTSDPDAVRRRLYIAIRKLRERGERHFATLSIRILNSNTLFVLNEAGSASAALATRE